MTSTEVCNMALALFGETEIANIQDTNDKANKCRLYYNTARRACLRDHKWNFAVTLSGELAEITPAPAHGWAHAFELPTDPECLRVLQLNGSDCARWEIRGKALYTDETTAVILYIYDAPADQWDALFIDMFTLLLGSKLALAVSHDASHAQALLNSYQMRIMDAKAVDGQEQGVQEPISVPDLTTNVRS